MGAVEFFWPRLEPLTSEQAEASDASEVRDADLIRRATWLRNPDLAVDEARRLSEAEAERRRTADGRASTYLALLAALVPIVLTTAMAIWDKKAGSAPPWVNMVGLGAGLAYIAAAGSWAFKTLQVAVTHRIDVRDLAAAWSVGDPRLDLTRRLLTATRRNRAGVNAKVTSIKMTHAFLLRAFFAFTMVLGFNILWSLAAAGYGAWQDSPLELVQSVEQALIKGKTGPAAAAKGCKAAKGKSLKAEMVTHSKMLPNAYAQLVLSVSKTEPVAHRHLRLWCGKWRLGEMHHWYVPARLPRNAIGRLDDPQVTFESATVQAPMILRPTNLRRTGVPAKGQPNHWQVRREALLLRPDGSPGAFEHVVVFISTLPLTDDVSGAQRRTFP